MTIRASVDTPWLMVSTTNGMVARPKLIEDPVFASDIISGIDVTGAGGVEVVPGRVLYGGNYAAQTGIQPDYDKGRPGGSGEPDYLTVEIEVFEESVLQAIDAVDDYWVYWDQPAPADPAAAAGAAGAGGAAARASAWRPRDQDPPDNEWGMLRSKLARRGVSQAWIDKYLGEDRLMPRGVHDQNMRYGYMTGQIPMGSEPVQMEAGLVSYLTDQGWRAQFDGMVLIVDVSVPGPDVRILISYSELIRCDYSRLDWPGALKNDICAFMVSRGYCGVCVE